MVRLSSPTHGRWLALVSLVAALAIMLTPMPVSAAVAEDSPAAMTADWIAREYQAPDSEIALFGTGVLIDALVSLAATGTESGIALDMLAELRLRVGDYVGTDVTFNPGAAGKALHVLSVYGEDPAVFVGTDVEAELRSSMATSGADIGRFGDALVIQQATAVLGLAMTDAGVPPEAVAHLSSQQCPNGEFTFDGTCPGPGDSDTTGLVVLALLAGGDDATAATSVAWLKSLQEPDGSIPGWGTPNSNSTAAAAQAFVAAGETTAAEAAAGFLESMQFPATADPADAGGLKWIASDTNANTFASVQGVWGMGVPALFDLVAPTFEFSDTAGTVFPVEIEWIAASGVTLGCSRALELPATAASGFTDVSGSVFFSDIGAIAAAGITRGCNPPVNDQYCPDRVVTRGEMAAFLNRAFDLPAAAGSGFTDTDVSVFAGDIEALAASGITKGCNPPANDMFCPYDPVSREQMAAFVYRALHR